MDIRLAGFVLVALLAVLPANASLRSAAPPRVDPFTGIADPATLKRAPTNRVDGVGELRLAALLSDNAVRHLEWSEKQTAGLGGIDRAFVGSQAGASTVDRSTLNHQAAYGAKAVSDGIMDPLVRKARSVTVVDSLAAFQDGEFDLLVLLDVAFVNTFFDSPVIVGGSYKSGAYFSARFIDREGTILAIAEVGETRAVPRQQFLYAVADLRVEMLERYRRAIDDVLGKADRPATPDPAPSNTAGAAQDADGEARDPAERLRRLERLEKEGLISPAEAAAKRREIVESL